MRNCMKFTYISVLFFTVIFAMVEIGLSADLTWEFNRSLLGFWSPIRARTRYLVFCSTWSIITGIVLLALAVADTSMSIAAQVIVLTMSMIFWLLGASLFTSVIGGHGLSCGGRRVCNIVNTTMAFAWINWSFIMIALILALWLAFFWRSPEQKEAPEKIQTRTANAPPVSNATGTNGQATRQSPPV